ncbi:MAG: tetratricopeptide repeat protein [Elusimicrobia bacterium]|nr:tetratricopeptide repeat protein [Elusimicrobiota bacterium]
MYKKIILVWLFFCCSCGLGYSSSYSALDPEQRSKFNELLDSAFSAYVAEDYEKSFQIFTRVLQIDPKDKTALKGLEQCKEKLEQNRKQREKLQREKIELVKKSMGDEDWVEAADNIASILLFSPNHTEALRLKNDVEAMIRKKMAMVSISSPDNLIFQGMIFYLHARYTQAIKAWKEAQYMVPENVKLAIYVKKAEQLYNDSIRYEVVTLGRQRAKSAFQAENYQEAVNLLKKIIEVEPEDEEAKKELAKAEGLLEKKSKENLLGEYYDKGLSLFLQEKYVESLKYWEAILSISPENEVAKNYVAKINAKGIKSETGAMPLVEVTPVLKTEGTQKPYDKALVFYEKGEYKESLQFLQTYVAKNPKDKEALEWIEKIKKEQTEKAQKFYQRGLVFYSEGSVEEAIKQWEAALHIDPNHAAAQRNLSKLKGEAQ